MEAVCMKIIEMSIAASWLILAVILLRFFLVKAPKGFRYVLWALVAIRLICPFSIESDFSLVPDTNGMISQGNSGNQLETTPDQGTILPGTTPSVPGTTPSVPGTTPSTPGTMPSTPGTTPSIPGTTPSTPGGTPDTTPGTAPSTPGTVPSVPDVNTGDSDIIPAEPQTGAIALGQVLPIVWGVGVALMLVYMAISYVRLWNRVKISVPIGENTYICDDIQSPFIFGVFRPTVYIPSYIEKDQLTYILAHEREHLRCLDHIWKPVGFTLLAMHWFNPLVWGAYILMCRDLELACDERVIRRMDAKEKRNYSETLLACSAPGHMISACPVAFGEIGIKERIKRVLSYKKPALWVMIATVVLCVVVAVCFMTDPAGVGNANQPETESESETESETDSDPETGTETETGTEPGTDIEPGTDTEPDIGTEPETGTEPEPGTEEPAPVYDETVLYETTADLNHDGIEDLVRTIRLVEHYGLNESESPIKMYIQVFAGIGNGEYESRESYRSTYLSIDFANNGAYYLAEKDGQDYLVFSAMKDYEDCSNYAYEAFYLGKGLNAQVVKVEDYSAIFTTSPFYPEWLDTPHREDEIPELQEKLSAWLADAIVLCIVDGKTPVYYNYSTIDAILSPDGYLESVWARNDEAELQRFYDTVGTEYWKMFFYNLDMSEMVDYYNALANADLSKWYQEYNGQILQRIPGDGLASLATNKDVIYYAAGESADVQAVLKKMIEAMILPRMEASADRNYTITKYRLVDQPVIQIADNIWLIECLEGYYAYEGYDGVASMEERLEYEEVTSDGMLEFDRDGGDQSEFFYLLVEENGVYRLEYGYYLDDVEEDTSVSTPTSYQEAYTQIINEWIDAYPEDVDELRFSLVYFDEDDIPELVAEPGYCCLSMYTYKNGQVHLVVDEWGYGAGGNPGYFYLPKKNVLYNHDADMAGAQNWMFFGKIDENNQLVSYYEESLRYQFITDLNGDGEESYYEWDGNTYYFYGEQEISGAEFETYLIGGTLKELQEDIFIFPEYVDLHPESSVAEILEELN